MKHIERAVIPLGCLELELCPSYIYRSSLTKGPIISASRIQVLYTLVCQCSTLMHGSAAKMKRTFRSSIAFCAVYSRVVNSRTKSEFLRPGQSMAVSVSLVDALLVGMPAPGTAELQPLEIKK